jgi:hypothetical protein
MKTYQFTSPDSDVVAVIDEDGISRMSMLASALPPDTEVLPYVAPPPAVPQKVTAFQAKAALLQAGLLDDVEALVNQDDTPRIIKLAWIEALHFERDSSTVATIAAALQLSDAQVDDLFINASSITA